MKNGKRAVSFILAVVLLCTSFAGCGMVQQDKAYLEQVAAAVTETQSILKDVETAADELSGQSSIVYENSVNAEGFDVLDEYYTLCTEKLNALNDAVGAVRQQTQSLERCDAPKTEKGKAVEAEQKAYFEDALEVIGGIQEALTFYTAQYDTLQPLVTATVGDRSDEQAYLISVYEAAGNVKTALSTLDTPEWLNDLWPKYVANLDVMTKYMESRSWGLAWSDVLRLYSANQLISRVGITSGRHEETMFDLYSREYNHAAFLLDENLDAYADEILAACESGKDVGAYDAQAPIVFSDYSTVEEIFPNLYPSMDSAINLLLYTDKGYTDVMVTAEIAGFTQKYEQKVTLTPEMTYLMIKPPVLADMPDLSTTKDTQMTLRVENTITGEAIIQETKNIALHSVYDYKNYSDEFGIIQNDNILAWMTPETDGILQVRRNAVSWLEQSFGTEYGMLPGYQPAYGFTSDQGAYITYYQVAAIQSAISSMGVRYNMGPYSFSASQRVLMPDAVLENGSGICIETAVLMASVLESASMHAMIVFTPGHAQTAVETWSGSGQYFLIETTMLPFTATQDALQSLIQPLSAEEWANYLYNKEQEAQQSGGMVYVVDCDLAPVLNIQGLNY